MVKDVAFKTLNIPAFLVSVALAIVSQSITSRINTNLFDLRPIDYVKKCTASAVFISGKEDGLVRPERAKKMFDKYRGIKKIFLLSEGGHNDEREDEITQQCMDIIKKEFLANLMESQEIDHRIKDSMKKNNKRIRPHNLPYLFKYAREQSKQVKQQVEKAKADKLKPRNGPQKHDSGKKRDKNFGNQINDIATSAVSKLQSEKLKNGIDLSRNYIEAVQDSDGNTSFNRPIKLAMGINKIKDAGLKRNLRTGEFEGILEKDDSMNRVLMEKQDYMKQQQYPRDTNKRSTFNKQVSSRLVQENYQDSYDEAKNAKGNANVDSTNDNSQNNNSGAAGIIRKDSDYMYNNQSGRYINTNPDQS